MGKRENNVETYLDKSVTALGGITRKWVSPGRSGVPDRIVILNGRVIFAEMKTSDGVLEPEQAREHRRLLDVGAYVVTIYGHQGVDEFIKMLEDKHWTKLKYAFP